MRRLMLWRDVGVETGVSGRAALGLGPCHPFEDLSFRQPPSSSVHRWRLRRHSPTSVCRLKSKRVQCRRRQPEPPYDVGPPSGP